MGKGKEQDVDHINHTMDESVVDRAPIVSPEDAMRKLNLTMETAYVDADAFTTDPYALLGQVIQIRKKDGVCPTSISDAGFPAELTAYPVICKVKESSKMKAPELRSSIIVDKTLAAKVTFLSYLSAELNDETHFSIMLFDQAKGLVDTTDAGWRTSLEQWKQENADLINDPEICYLFIVGGFVQKNIVRKKYVKFSGKASGGIYGININGELSTATDQYSLDIKFGLTPLVIKRPAAPSTERVVRGMKRAATPAAKKAMGPVDPKPTKGELNLFSSISGKLALAKKSRKPVMKVVKSTAAAKTTTTKKAAAGKASPKKAAAKKVAAKKR